MKRLKEIKRKLHKPLLFIALLISIANCNDNDNVTVTNETETETEETTGNSQYYFLEKIDSFSPTNYNSTLGHSFDYYSNETALNTKIGVKVIDLNSLKEDSSFSNIIHTKPIGTREFSINTYNSYEKANKDKTHIINSNLGSNIKLKPFNEFKESFKDVLPYINSAYLGRINITYSQEDINLSLNENLIAEIIEKHLSKPFQKGMYTESMGRFTGHYSPFVLVGYRSGASFSVLVAAKKNTEKTDLEEDGFKKILKESFTIRGKDIDGKNKEGNDSYIKFKDENMFFTKTQSIGGSPNDNLTFNSIYFSKWLASSTEPGRQTIIDITPEGLIPTSTFILEENFKRRFSDIHKGVLPRTIEEKEPRINIAKVFVRTSSDGEALYDIAGVLETRNGDNIILTPVRYNAKDADLKKLSSPSEYQQRERKIAEYIKPFFKDLKILSSPNKVIRPYLRYELSIEFPFKFTKKEGIYRYLNTKNNVWYIYDTNTHLAFAYYDIASNIPGSSGIDEIYGCSEWIHELPEKPISIYELRKYWTIKNKLFTTLN